MSDHKCLHMEANKTYTLRQSHIYPQVKASSQYAAQLCDTATRLAARHVRQFVNILCILQRTLLRRSAQHAAKIELNSIFKACCTASLVAASRS